MTQKIKDELYVGEAGRHRLAQMVKADRTTDKAYKQSAPLDGMWDVVMKKSITPI